MNAQIKRPLDAEIRFHFGTWGVVEVNEVRVDGTKRTRNVPRTSDIVTELEESYMFFANEANHARKKIASGFPCAFYVSLREP
jgi:hypothetical protein